jgi:hypothetical protein
VKTSVTDGQLGQLAVKLHELFRRAKGGAYEDFDKVLAGLQALIEGKEPVAPTLATEEKFAAWRTFRIGGVNAKALLVRVQAQASLFLSGPSKDLMKDPAFTTLKEGEKIGTLILTPADFGYERFPTTTELLDLARLAEWSKRNAHRLPKGCVVELLPAEAGPHISDQYTDQPKGEVLWIAMRRMTDSDGCPRIFCVGCDDGGWRWLYARRASPTGRWELSSRLVFRLRKVA